MYLLNTQAEISWVLGVTPNTILLSDLSIITVKPNGSTNFASVVTYVAPTSTIEGLVTHLLTPDVEGLWDITLIKGPVDTYTKLSTAMLYVFDNVTDVEPRSYSNGSLLIVGT
jgi:hypothetical protein